MWPFRKEETSWEEKFQPLADYNSEVGRGIVHTKNYDEEMKKLQEEYNKKVTDWCDRNGYKIIGT